MAARAREEFVADTIVRLSIEPVQRVVLRSLEIVKSRGHEFALGPHTFRIVNGPGLEVWRRVQARRGQRRETGAAFDPTTRVTTGVPGLDDLVNGGYFVSRTRRALTPAAAAMAGSSFRLTAGQNPGTSP
jgi:circadian clock protein KaiC